MYSAREPRIFISLKRISPRTTPLKNLILAAEFAFYQLKPNKMTLQELTDQIRTKVTHADNINATVKLVTDKGVIFIDASQSPALVSNEDKQADCDLHVSIDNLVKMSTGDLNPMMAVMTGKLKIKGDMGIAMKMGQIMG